MDAEKKRRLCREIAKKREVRSVECQLSVREAAPDATGESRTISGTAIVVNAESEVLDDWGYRFREVIMPEAVTMEFLNTQDVKMNMLHERDLTVARCNHGTGSMRLSVDDKGVHFEFEAPRCDIGDRCLEMVRRGDYSGCSFEFYPEEFDIEERDGGDDIKIIHRKFAAITALTIGMDPAYRQTSVNVREVMMGDEAEKQPEAPVESEDEKEREERERLLMIERERSESGLKARMRTMKMLTMEEW